MAGAGEALMLNTDGNLAEATGANVFFVEDGAMITPPIPDGPLPGIVRARVIDRAMALGISVREVSVPGLRLRLVTEMFLTSSLIGICPVTEPDGRPLQVGDVTKRLIEIRVANIRSAELVEGRLTRVHTCFDKLSTNGDPW